jgi:hypothetical protein
LRSSHGFCLYKQPPAMPRKAQVNGSLELAITQTVAVLRRDILKAAAPYRTIRGEGRVVKEVLLIVLQSHWHTGMPNGSCLSVIYLSSIRQLGLSVWSTHWRLWRHQQCNCHQKEIHRGRSPANSFVSQTLSAPSFRAFVSVTHKQQ